MLKRCLRWIAPPLVSAGILVVLFSQINAQRVWGCLTGADWRWLLAAALLASGLPTFSTLRWRTIVVAMGCPLAFSTCLRVTFAAFPLNAFLPSKSGDLIKAALLRRQAGFVPLAGSVLFERLVDIAVLTALSVLGAVWLSRPAILLLALACAAAALAAITALAFARRLPTSPRLKERAEEVGRAAHLVAARPRTFACVLLWSTLNWLGAMAVAYCLFCAVRMSLPFSTVVAVLPLAIFVGLLPCTVSGLGTRDGALVLLLSGIAQEESVLAAALLYTSTNYWLLALLGLPFLLRSLAVSDATDGRP